MQRRKNSNKEKPQWRKCFETKTLHNNDTRVRTKTEGN